jgi:hypothetical protein
MQELEEAAPGNVLVHDQLLLLGVETRDEVDDVLVPELAQELHGVREVPTRHVRHVAQPLHDDDGAGLEGHPVRDPQPPLAEHLRRGPEELVEVEAGPVSAEELQLGPLAGFRAAAATPSALLHLHLVLDVLRRRHFSIVQNKSLRHKREGRCRGKRSQEVIRIVTCGTATGTATETDLLALLLVVQEDEHSCERHQRRDEADRHDAPRRQPEPQVLPCRPTAVASRPHDRTAASIRWSTGRRQPLLVPAVGVHNLATEPEVVVERARGEPSQRAGAGDLALEEVVGHVEDDEPVLLERRKGAVEQVVLEFEPRELP